MSTRNDSIVGEKRLRQADSALHDGLLDTKHLEGRVWTAADTDQITATTVVATPTFWVVIQETAHLAMVLGHARLCLFGLRAQISILALQRPNALTKQAQMLAKNRSRAALIDQRLHFFEQKFKHLIASTLFKKNDGSRGSKGGAA